MTRRLRAGRGHQGRRLGVALLLGVALVLPAVPSIRRYWRMTRM